MHPLPWSRTYVLLIPPGPHSLGALIPADSAAFRAGLARDAVQVEARGAEPPYWWEAMAALPRRRDPASSSSRRRRTPWCTLAEDAVARALAERVVALSDEPATGARGLPARAMPTALRGGLGRAYVVALPRTALVPCREVGRLAGRRHPDSADRHPDERRRAPGRARAHRRATTARSARWSEP